MAAIVVEATRGSEVEARHHVHAVAVSGGTIVDSELIRGASAADTELMRLGRGWVAKGGAEGLLCAASRDGLGIALKVEDGSTRAVRNALAAFLSRLGHDVGDLGRVPVTNSRGEVVGELPAV